MLIIAPVSVFLVVIGNVHWLVLIVIGLMLITANIITCCCCVWDSYKFIDKYETQIEESDSDEELPK